MKFEVEELDIESSKPIESNAYAFDIKDIGMAFHAFVNYSNPLGSFIREIASNAWDANVENEKYDEPIIISYKDNQLHFQDKGIGISPDRMSSVFQYFFKSTKRNTNGQIGAWGLGSKSPLGYVDTSFSLITVYDNKEYHYVITKKASGPTIDLVDTIDVLDKPTGTTVIVPMKHEPHDVTNEIRKQLIYFHNVYYNGLGLNNEYKIEEANTFLYSKEVGLQTLHLAYGPVIYPIDRQLYMSIIKDDFNHNNKINDEETNLLENLFNIPIGLKFDIGELDVTWNRESVQFNDKSINAIKYKLLLLLSEIKSYIPTLTPDYLESFLNNSLDNSNEFYIKNHIINKLNLYPCLTTRYFSSNINNINNYKDYTYSVFRKGKNHTYKVIKDIELKEYQIKYFINYHGSLINILSYEEFIKNLERNIYAKISIEKVDSQQEVYLKIIYNYYICTFKLASSYDYPKTSLKTESDGSLAYATISYNGLHRNKINSHELVEDKIKSIIPINQRWIVSTYANKKVAIDFNNEFSTSKYKYQLVFVSQENYDFFCSLPRAISFVEFIDKFIPRLIKRETEIYVLSHFNYSDWNMLKFLADKFAYFKIMQNKLNLISKSKYDLRLKLSYSSLDESILDEFKLLKNTIEEFKENGSSIFKHIRDLTEFLKDPISIDYVKNLKNPLLTYKLNLKKE